MMNRREALEYTCSTWRLLRTAPASGAWNMAVDEAILEAVGRETVPATLRLYSWQPACLSLGYAQPSEDVDQEALRKRGWELVRRPTGGKAILHTDEITYSVIGPEHDERLSGGVLESYLKLSQALIRTLGNLNISAESVERPAGARNSTDRQAADNATERDFFTERASEQNPVCFEVPSTYEITIQGRKIIGSAQARRKEGVLQHGSLPLQGDLTRILEALILPEGTTNQKAAERLLRRATTVERALGRLVLWEEAAQAFVKVLARA
jgi:lipoate-protein ligase A